jgi:hypothetical protein
LTPIIRDLSFDDLGRATGDVINNVSLSTEGYADYMAIKKMAAVNGFSTGWFDPEAQRLIPTNHLLEKINGVLDSLGMGTYKDLDKVPFDTAEMAMRKLKEAKGEVFNKVFRGVPSTKVEIPPALQSVFESAMSTTGTTLVKDMDQRVGLYVRAVAHDMAYVLDSVRGRGFAYKNYPNWWHTNLSTLSYKGETGSKAIVTALYNIAEGKDGTNKIFNELREFILKDRIGAYQKSEFYTEPAEAMMAEMKRMIQAYSPEPSVLDDALPDLMGTAPTMGAGATTELFGGTQKTVQELYQKHRSSILEIVNNDAYNANDNKEMISILADMGKNKDDLEKLTSRELRVEFNRETNKLFKAAKTPTPTGAAVTAEKDFTELDNIQAVFNDMFDTFDLNRDDQFWNAGIKVPAPEFVSDPQAFLAAAPEIRANFQNLMNMVAENHGRTADVFNNPGLAEKLAGELYNKSAQLEATMRLAANEYGTGFRNFALVDYESRRNIDTLTGLLMPYQFWYGRTYANWGRRLAHNPAIVANYSRYKEMMSQIHAGLPEYWRQNINSYELLGLFPDNPKFFNLEQTLNPLQGLTNVDFEDPYKRVDAWSRTLDDVNRFGPTTNPIYSFATAFAYYLRGEKEAASRWGGRLFPQTNTLKALQSVLGMTPTEVDPAVLFFSGGIDPYERRRVGRAFPQMILEGQLTPEQAIDAAWSQEGPYWEEARQRAVGERAPGNLMSFFLGAGWKGRNKGDIATDMMYDEFFGLMNRRQDMTNDQFKQEMNRISSTYPFMDSVLISAKTGWARDLAYAYATLDRIPPGDTNRLYSMAGIDDRLVEKFYDSKGDLGDWAPTDRSRFMAGVIDINAMLEIPDNYTAQMWTNAKSEYSKINDRMKQFYGEDILNEIDYFYALKNDGRDKEAQMFLDSNPMVETAMSYKLGQIVNDPTGALAPYYSGMSKISSYYYNQMYNESEQKFPGVKAVQDQYYLIPSDNYQAKKAFRNANPILTAYWDWKAEQEKIINQKVIDLTKHLPQGIPAQLRTDNAGANVGIGAQDIGAGLNQPEDALAQVTSDQWHQALGQQEFAAIYNYLQSGQDMEYQVRNSLKEQADQLGISLNRLIQYVGLSLQQ